MTLQWIFRTALIAVLVVFMTAPRISAATIIQDNQTTALSGFDGATSDNLIGNSMAVLYYTDGRTGFVYIEDYGQFTVSCISNSAVCSTQESGDALLLTSFTFMRLNPHS